jgi:hypothetical protein
MREHAADVGVDRRQVRVMGEDEHRTGGVRSYAGQVAKLFHVVGEVSRPAAGRRDGRLRAAP